LTYVNFDYQFSCSLFAAKFGYVKLMKNLLLWLVFIVEVCWYENFMVFA